MTKKNAPQTIPLTEAVLDLVESCDLNDRRPFVTQLRTRRTASRGRPMRNATVNSHQMRKEFAELRRAAGIERRITPHDLRRTTAVALYRHTHDIRAVQSLLGHRALPSTIWYLDNDLQPVNRDTLEAIKKPFIIARKEQTA